MPNLQMLGIENVVLYIGYFKILQMLGAMVQQTRGLCLDSGNGGYSRPRVRIRLVILFQIAVTQVHHN